MKKIRWILTLPLALILVIFAINNRHVIEVSLWPFYFTIQWPLFVFLYISLVVGFLSGAFLIWVSGVQLKLRYLKLKKNKKDGAKSKGEINNDTQEVSRVLLD